MHQDPLVQPGQLVALVPPVLRELLALLAPLDLQDRLAQPGRRELMDLPVPRDLPEQQEE